MFRKTIDSRYVPKGSVKVCDKKSDAVAYIWSGCGVPRAIVYVGKQSKPVANYRYRNEKDRAASVAKIFATRQAAGDYKAERRAKRKAFVNPYKKGDIFMSSWGYDQTNVDYYECVGVSGKILTVRKIGSKSIEDGFMTGKCTPMPGEFIGEEKRFKAQEGGFKVASYAYATYQEPKMIAGVPVYGVDRYSSYA